MDPERETTGQLALHAASASLELYAANPAARAVVTAIPLIGGMFDAMMGTAGANIALERIRVMVDELSAALQRLEAAKRDPAVTSDQLIDAALRAVRGAIETGHREKVRLLVAVLVGATSVERPQGLDAESVLASLVNLTPADLDYARRLADAVRNNRDAIIEYAAVPVPDPDSQYRLMRLQGAGLLEAQSPPPSWGAGAGLNYRLTPTFWRMMDLLREGGVEIKASAEP